MAELGFRTIDDMIGRADRLDVRPAVDHWKAAGVDLSKILHQPAAPGAARHQMRQQDHGLADVLDRAIIAAALPAIERREPVTLHLPIRNANRAAGTMLGYEITRRHGGAGLPDDTIRIHFTGSAGQSFGAFVPRGVTLSLEGDANDFWGKGLSGGRLLVFPHRGVHVPGRRTTSSSATWRSTAPRAARPTSAASRASASRFATAAPTRSSKASAITAAST